MAYTFLDLAEEVLNKSSIPLTYQEIWNIALQEGLEKKLSTTGKTPWQTLGARLFVEVRDNQNSKFIKVAQRPARFFISANVHLLSNDILNKLESKDSIESVKEDYKERILHPLLAYFAYSNPLFNVGLE